MFISECYCHQHVRPYEILPWEALHQGWACTWPCNPGQDQGPDPTWPSARRWWHWKPSGFWVVLEVLWGTERGIQWGESKNRSVLIMTMVRMMMKAVMMTVLQVTKAGWRSEWSRAGAHDGSNNLLLLFQLMETWINQRVSLADLQPLAGSATKHATTTIWGWTLMDERWRGQQWNEGRLPWRHDKSDGQTFK